MKKKQLKQRIAELEQQVADLEAELARRPQYTFVPYDPNVSGKTITFPLTGRDWITSDPFPYSPYRIWCAANRVWNGVACATQ